MTLEAKYSTEKDAQTYIGFIRNFESFKHGRENIQDKLLAKLEPSLQEILTKSKTDEDALAKTIDYLELAYKSNPKLIEDSISKFNSSWNLVGGNVIYSLEFLYKKRFPFENVTMYLTANSIFPYNYEQRYFFATHKFLNAQLSTAKHELNHFMFYYYYPKNATKLDAESYELLKESLTFFSNPDQEGKPNEKPLRELYKSKLWENLDEAIAAATEFLLKE